MRRRWLHIALLACTGPLAAQQLYVGPSATVHISNLANLEVGGDLENQGNIENVGFLSLYGNWNQNATYNGGEGTLIFRGEGDRTVTHDKITLAALIAEHEGEVSLEGGEYTVTDRLDFRSGTLSVGGNTSFILDENGIVYGGHNGSYFNGPFTSLGSRDRVFPVGDGGVYAPLTLFGVQGVSPKITVRYVADHEKAPVPSDSLLGVSHRGLWEYHLSNGVVTNEVRVQAVFDQDDLSDFRVFNDIRHKIKSPVIAFVNNLNEEWGSLGVSSLLDTDSLTYGTIISKYRIKPIASKGYLAVGMAPLVPDEGLYFIPEVFSPNATDRDNQTFKVFGINIIEEGFYLRVFNRMGIVVYETSSYAEASEGGWDGRNLNGAEEPTGIYFYEVRLQFESEAAATDNGSFYLVR